MIVPRAKLLFWVAVAVVPLATVAVAAPETTAACVGLLAGFLAVVTSDALRARRSLDGISVTLPAVVRLFRERDGGIEVQVNQGGRESRELRLGMAFPDAIATQTHDRTITLPAGAPLSKFVWSCRPLQRGKFKIERCYLEAGSPMGFWGMRAAQSTHSEIRVYPNLMAERKSVAAQFLNRGKEGVHAQRQVGQGRDFEKLREYIAGDSLDEIHWKATAKRGRPVTKVFQVERTQEVYVIIDASRLSARLASRQGDTEASTTILERFITAALVLGLAAEKQGDLFGTVLFTDRVQKFLRAKSGKEHFNVCRDSLYALQPQLVTPDFEELCSFIRLRLRRRALLVFLTSMDDPVMAESFVHNIGLICRQHLVVVNMLQPEGVAPLFTSGTPASLDEMFGRLSGHLLWNNIRELEKVLQRRGVSFSMLKNEALTAQLISQYMSVKQRQLL